MIWNQLKGHRAQVDMLRQALHRGRLAHAYLFTGPEGIGKRLVARLVAQCLLCRKTAADDLDACGECSACRQVQAGTHPDLLTAGCPEGKRVLPIDVFAGPPDRRGREGLCHDLALRPMAGTRRVAVVDDAHLMNAESANALLKTLEEPPSYSMLILIAAGVEGLLPTIRSRCQRLRFAPLPEADVAELVLELGWTESPEEAVAAAALSEGSLAVAAQLLDANLRRMRDELFAGLAARPFDSLALARAMIDGIDALGGDAPAQRQSASWLIRFCLEFFRGALRQLAGEAAASARLSAASLAGRLPADGRGLDLIAGLMDRTLEAELQIQRSTSVPLCLEGLFDEIGRRLRAAGAA